MYNVLIADDEAIIREGLKCIVDWHDLGFVIEGEASNGADALTFMETKNPDVVLLDIRMPKMLGLESIKLARKHGFSGKVIILSGYSDFKYAQEAITCGVEHYLTKPVDEDELEEILISLKKELDKTHALEDTTEHFKLKARETVIRDVITGNFKMNSSTLNELGLSANIFQIVVYEKFSHAQNDAAYRFSDLLRVTNHDFHSFDSITIAYKEVVLLKGSYAIQKFNDFLERYNRETRPQKDSPLDTLFLAYGHCVSSIEEIRDSYKEALTLLDHRFFCEQAQHTLGYMDLPHYEDEPFLIDTPVLNYYAETLTGYIQSFNRNMLAQTLHELEANLYQCKDSISAIKLFLADLYLQIKETIHHLYHTMDIPFPSNSSIIKFMESRFYLYEIILFFTEQFETIMNSIGTSSKDSVLDDIIHYIEFNYASNITLENIAPLFGYNSSYLGKIFSKKMGENFNSYIDHIRIEHSKKLLRSKSLKVYQVAESVGYRNVDYFHIKFKKYVGQSPAEYRKSNLSK